MSRSEIIARWCARAALMNFRWFYLWGGHEQQYFRRIIYEHANWPACLAKCFPMQEVKPVR